MTRRRRAMLAVGVVATLLTGHLLLWVFVGAQLRAGFLQASAAAASQGWVITAGTPRLQGWPLAATLVVPDLHLAGGERDIPGGVAWQAPSLTLSVSLRHPLQLRVASAGAQTLRVGMLPPIPYEAESMWADVALDRDAPPHAVAFSAVRLRAVLPGGELAVGEIQGRADTTPGLLVMKLAALAIDLPPPPNGSWALGARVASLVLDASLSGSAPDLPDPAARASAWRDSGGTAALRQLEVRWGRLHLDATATLGLDAALQPAGTATARLVDPAATVDALEAGGAFPPSTARAAKAVLALLTRVPQGGGPPEVSAPLTLRNRSLAFAGFPLLRLPEFIWPGAR